MKAFLRIMRNFIGPIWITEYEIQTRSKLPPWWMGVAYADICRNSAVLYAVPLHRAVTLLWRLNQAWRHYLWHGESWIDREISKAIEKERERVAAKPTANMVNSKALSTALPDGDGMKGRRITMESYNKDRGWCIIASHRQDDGKIYERLLRISDMGMNAIVCIVARLSIEGDKFMLINVPAKSPAE